MCWMCDHPDETVNDYLATVRTIIRTHGWAVQYVESDRSPIAYTMGLHARGLPELLITGLSPDDARWVLNTYAKRVASSGRTPVPGEHVSLPAGVRVEIVDVERPDAHVGMAMAMAGSGITAVQLVWADGRGRWPWAPGFDDGHRHQRVLGVRAQNA